MSGDVLPGALAAIRAELEALIGLVDVTDVPRKPLRREAHREGELAIWHDAKLLRVHTMADVADCVFIAEAEPFALSGLPDWSAISPADARRLANALLASARECERNAAALSRTSEPT